MHRKIYIKYLLTTCLLLAAANFLHAQDQAPSKPGGSGESIQLFCDRGMYAVSEHICFTAFYQPPSQAGALPWSTVLYAELIRWNGTKLAQQKVRIKNGRADGYLAIPGSVRSGNYYLRVYTRWMRNYSPYTYTYVPIKIVNPFVGEIDEGHEANIEEIAFARVQEIDISKDMTFSGLNKNYKTRELVEFEISVPNMLASGEYCLGVARTEVTGDISAQIYFSAHAYEDTISQLEYLPEIRGLSLSGKVIDQDSREAAERVNITLTSLTKPFYFSNVYSDSLGDFIFSIPGYSGSHQFCIKTGYDNNIAVEFLLSSDYCTQAILLPYLPFELSSEEKKLAEELVTNAQLTTKYSSGSPVAESGNDYPPFYGRAQSVTYIKDYIELIDLREFFFELVPDVYIKYKNRKPYLELAETHSMITSFPMLLFDNIPVSNDETLLNIPSREIDRIEVINGGYIVGKNMYSGIISIYSNNGDLAGIDMTGNARFFTYSLLNQEQFTAPDYSENRSSRKADPRNLLFWDPDIDISDKTAQKVSFYTSDAIGGYSITLRGVDKSGAVIYGQAQFIVK